MPRPRSHLTIFDFDGVLVDTEEIVVEAYRRAGVIPPGGLSLGSWRNWLPGMVGEQQAHVVHEAKNRHYLELLPTARLLPPYEHAVWLQDRGYETGILTSAPLGTLEVFGKMMGAWRWRVAFENVMPMLKMEYLKRLGTGTYWDDRYVEVPDGWEFVRYTGGEV